MSDSEGNLVRARLVVLAVYGFCVCSALLHLYGSSLPSRWRLCDFLVLNAMVLASSRQITLLLGAETRWEHLVLDTAIVFLAVVVMIQMLLGTAGLLDISTLLITVGGLSVAVRAVSRNRHATRSPAETSTLVVSGVHGHSLVWGLAAGLVLFAVAQVVWARWLSPPDTTDALRYHLPFAVKWLQSGLLDMPIPVAGDPASPFFPLNSSLWIAWLIAPFNSDIMAQIVQAPFVLIGLLATVRLAQQLQLPRETAWTAGLLVISLPAVARDSFVVENDLIVAVLLLSATAYIVDLWRYPRRRTTLLTAITLGLALGTKAPALPYVTILIIAYATAIVRGWHGSGWMGVACCLAIGVAAIACLGGYSYVRNWFVMGNPLYPMIVNCGDRIVLPGLYALTREWKQLNPYFAFDWQAFFVESRVDFGWVMPLWVFPGLVLCIWRIWQRREIRWLVMLLWTAVCVGVFWYILPYHQARYLYATVFGAIVLATSGWAAAFAERSLLLPGVAIPLLAVNALSIPKFARPWTSPAYWAAGIGIVAVGVLIVALPHWSARKDSGSRVLCAVASILLVIVVSMWPCYEKLYESQRFKQWRSHPGVRQAEAWAWIAHETQGEGRFARIAVAGTDVIFPLHGPTLTNQLVAIGDDGSTVRFGWTQTFVLPGAPDRDAWYRAIERERIDYIFVTPHVVVGGWPEADEWAAARPESFDLVHASDGAHIWLHH